MKNLSVSIVIANWNGLELLKNNLSQVIKIKGYDEIIIADDYSDDGSVKYINEHFPQIKVIRSYKHQGFASTINLGVEEAAFDIVICLNTDVIPETNFIAPLLNHFKDPLIFAVGCKDVSYEGENIVERGRGLAGWCKGFFIHQRGEVNKFDTAWVSGGSGAFRKSIWYTLGGMDKIYNPFYWEDIDLSYRALKAGYRLYFEAKSVVRHYHQSGKIKSLYSDKFVKLISYRNQFIFIWKNLSDKKIIISHLLWLPIRILQCIIRLDLNMLIGFILAVLKIPAIYKSRLLASRCWELNDKDVLPVS